MPYTTQQLIITEIPSEHLNDALDDSGAGAPDAGLLDNIIASASQAVDAFLAGIYVTPFPDPAPALVREAAFTFACERIYGRRPVKDNPWTQRADAMRSRLKRVGNRELPLDATIPVVAGASSGTQPQLAGRIITPAL